MIDSSDRLRISLRFAIPTIWVAFALSIVIHALVLWGWHPVEHELTLDQVGPGKASGPLVLQIAPQPSRATSPPPAPPSAPTVETPSPARKAQAAKPAPRPPPPPPPVIAQEKPSPVIAPPPAPPPPARAATPDPGDFSALLEARRRARGAPPEDSAPPTESPQDERERHNQAVAANLGLNRTPTFGRDLTGGGVFQIQRMGVDSAEFLFFGWNKDIRRNSTQRVEVSKGDNANIRIAVVRRMIVIIRDHESGDFTWVSRRLGRDVILSARARDNAGLEDFLMEEFFFDAPVR
jgi:outer membrane biosynthesis protein TonB